MKSHLAWLTFGVLAVACGSGDKNRLLSRLESAGDRCPTPGVVVVSGLDDDGDGTLDDDEVDTTDLICSNDTLTRVDALAVGSVCPAGGTAVNVGVDDNDDGLLEDVEIDYTQNICKGTLVRSTALGPEDPACYGLGGVRLEIGIDDNGDDVLGVDEVDTTTVTCNVPGTTVPPAGPPGTAQILLNGGPGTGGRGGSGGSLSVEHGASGGGSLAIFRTGTVDTTFTLLTRTPVPGATPSAPATVTIPEVTLSLAGPVAGPAAGVLYAAGFTGGSFRLFVSNGGNAGDETPITSLTVGAGVTVTFGGGAENPLRLSFNDDVVNNGTIMRNGVAKGLSIGARAYVGGTGSTIDLKGGAGATGGTGGALTLTLAEVFVNQGSFDVSGGLGSGTGGPSGTISVRTIAGSLHNAGDLRASGGDVSGASGNGGAAGSIVLRANGGKLANRGNLVAVGGPGKTNGGAGGTIHLIAIPGDVVNGGELDIHGGSPTCSTTCIGGNAGAGPQVDIDFLDGSYGGIVLMSRGGGVFSSAKLTATGGTVTSAGGCGGPGGPITVEAFSPGSGGISGPSQGSLRFSGTIDASGGTGGSGVSCTGDGGGAGGSVYVFTEILFPMGQEVLFLGYTDVHAHAGAGIGLAQGNPGGSVQLRRYGGSSANIGAIVNHADLDLLGGPGGTGSTGGQGGYAHLTFNNTSISGVGANRVINLGGVLADGAMGGYGGSGQFTAALLYGPEGVRNDGAITAMGGPGAAGSSFFGGSGGEVVMSSDVGSVSNIGTIKVTGGSAFSGSSGGNICLEGNFVSNTKDLDASAGSGTSTNGNGGTIQLSSYNQVTASSGLLTAAAGTGTGAPGTPGQILVDVAQNRCFGNER